jgi:hypothetical protein
LALAIGLENGSGWISRSTVSAEPLASTHVHLSNRPVTLIAESHGYPLTGYGGIVNRARLTWPAAALAGFSHFLIMRRGRPESERRNLLIRPATRAWRKLSSARIGGVSYCNLRTREEERFLNPTASLTSSKWLALLGSQAQAYPARAAVLDSGPVYGKTDERPITGISPRLRLF